MAVGAMVLAIVLAMGLDQVTSSPEELALAAENEALQEQLEFTQERIEGVSAKLEELSEADQEIYRKLLQADPISEDVRQVGVGGSDPYARFSRFSTPTASLLKETTNKLDEIERQIDLQSASYRELTKVAGEQELWLGQMPAILPANGKIISGFGMRHHPILKITRLHKGVDILVGTGTPVYATGDGVVTRAGRNSGYGINIVLQHPKAGYETLYAHLSKIPNGIKEGTRVKRGDLIGLSGNTGLSKSPHLHYEVHDLDGRGLNPIYFFAPSMTPQQFKQLQKASESSTISLD
jgi:murein DD-endopeptidase MepM/ murein hydrolase activator NlpD